MGVGPYDSLISLRAGGDAAHLYAALFLDEIEVGTGQRRKESEYEEMPKVETRHPGRHS